MSVTGTSRGGALSKRTEYAPAGRWIAALRRVAGNRHLGEITVAPDPEIQAIVATWATETEFARATALGLPREANLDEIVEAYIEDFLGD